MHLAKVLRSDTSELANYLDLDYIEIHNVQPEIVSRLLAEQTCLGLRFSFDTCSNTIYIRMPSKAHQSPHHWFEKRFSVHLESALEAYGLSVYSLGSIEVPLHIGNQSIVYEPDASFSVSDFNLDDSQSDPSGSESASNPEVDLTEPSIVAEVAYSEGLLHAKRKACQWLYGSNEVQVVMLINIVRPSKRMDRLDIQRYRAYLEVWKKKGASTQAILADTHTTSTASFVYDGMEIHAIYQDNTNDLMDSSNINNIIHLELKDFVPQRFHDVVSDTFTFEIRSLRRMMRVFIKKLISQTRASIHREEEAVNE